MEGIVLIRRLSFVDFKVKYMWLFTPTSSEVNEIRIAVFMPSVIFPANQMISGIFLSDEIWQYS